MPSIKKLSVRHKRADDKAPNDFDFATDTAPGPNVVSSRQTDSAEADKQMKAYGVEQLRQLLVEVQLLAFLQQRELAGVQMNDQERTILKALQLKRATILKETHALDQAGTAVMNAASERDKQRLLCDEARPQQLTLHTRLLRSVEMKYRTAARALQRKLSALSSHEWIGRLVLAIGALSTLGWLGNKAFIASIASSTKLLQEANQMVHTIRATTELVQTASHQGAKWTLGALGSATGAAGGVLLSSLASSQPSSNYSKSVASALVTAALGAYAGWTRI